MPDKNKGGRPRKEIDLNELEKLCKLQATASECCSWFGVDDNTLDRRIKEAGWAGFGEFYKKHSQDGLISLRRAQLQAAVEDRNPTMLVWMGKQLLGQKDKVENELTGSVEVKMIRREIVRPDDKDI